MGGSLQRMRNREELTQLLNEAFPDSAKFGSVKLTLAPDWLADPARLQAEGRNASTVSFAFEDAGGLTSARLMSSPTLYIYGRKCEIKKFNPKPLLQTCSKCVRYGHTERQCRTKKPRCHKCGRNNHTTKNTTRTTALAVSVTAKATRANASTARPAASTAIVSIPLIAPRCPNSDAPSRKLLLTGPQTAMTERHCIQLNVAGCNPRMHALLNEPLYAHFDIFIFQDIWRLQPPPPRLGPRRFQMEKQTPEPNGKEFRDYAEFNDLTIMNHTSHPTRIASNPLPTLLSILRFLTIGPSRRGPTSTGK
ncbi:hypothetical protein RhiXN_01706 [Rhizoctonia solani]|uniref:CCHC-type domain-containing protein n=1 Tax=Rhizoctonia solani TaxID=456999 RepID=A0A8H8PBD5_9AGAM|nr:uncharacterized protein RhiXN_01706 [Rhizoctonia solani]QRW27111.1 hypothetical protein RhiXN_01706 [Rhizoctonia solani]